MSLHCELLQQKRKFFQTCLSVIVLAAFSFFPLSGNAAEQKEIIVSAAASLTNAFADIKEAFEKKYPDITVRLNFAASNPLLKQMEQGAPVDVFASADQETMDKACKAAVVEQKSRVNFARNSLVLIVPKGGTSLKTVDALLQVKRLAVGNPASVPAGRYAREALSAAGIWEKVQPAIITGTNVRQVLDYVSRGEVDAGIVYGTDAAQQAARVDVALVLSGHTPVLYPIAVATTGQNAQEGSLFLDFVCSPEGQAVLARFGFDKP